MDITDLKKDGNNYRKHSEKNKRLIRKSVRECGLGRSIVVDKDNVIVAGNGIMSVLPDTTPIQVVETDGTKLVVVRRTDIGTNDEKRKRLALADNATADKVEWDTSAIMSDFNDVTEWGIAAPKETEKLSMTDYVGIYYEPKNRPNIMLSECCDMTKYRAKLDVINNANISDEIKEQLRIFAYRFIKIDFESVANYYAFCADDEQKKVIERLRLVLVDNGQNGFVEDDLLRIQEQIFDIEDDE